MNAQAAPIFMQIVVPLDGSALAEQALPFAHAVGGETAALTLVTVLPPPPAAHGHLLGRVVEVIPDVHARAVTAAREGLLRAAKTWLGERPGVAVEVAEGDPATEIMRIAGERGADLIVLAGHGRGAIGRIAFGSVADRLAHVSPVPVMVVRPRDAAAEIAPAAIERLIVPLDGSDLAARAIPVARELARQLAVPVVLVRAVDLAEVLGPVVDTLVIPPELVEDTESEARRSLEAVAASLRDEGIDAEVEVWIGPAFNAIAEAARPGDVVVLCSHGRSGVTRWLLGSVAEKLVRDGPVPVILVPVGKGTSPAS